MNWIVKGTETSNFSYELTDKNREDLASVVAFLTSTEPEQIQGYFLELLGDEELKFLLSSKADEKYANGLGNKSGVGRRIVWYALVRLLRPKLVVETGVDAGVGGLVLCRALSKNHSEGYVGAYLGTDINPLAGSLFTGSDTKFGQIVYGDSIETLKNLEGKVDLFINDSDHSPSYEYEEYLTIQNQLSFNGIILGDNAHSTNSLNKFSRFNGRNFIFCVESPENHWYPGAGVGFSFSSFPFTPFQ